MAVRPPAHAYSSGIITTVAGNGSYGFSGDGGAATRAQLNGAIGVAADGSDSLFIADRENNRVRKVSPDGIITTVAAQPGCLDVAVDAAGNLFVATSGDEYLTNQRVLKVAASGAITTVAGTGMAGFSSDGGPAANALLGVPASLAVDAVGSVYMADSINNAVRILRPTDRSVLISAVVDAASQREEPVSPGKVAVIYGGGLSPSQLIQNQSRNGVFGAELGGTTVSFNGIAAPLLYTSATPVVVIVPYAITGTTAQVTVSYQGEVSAAFTVPVVASSPGIFTLNQTAPVSGSHQRGGRDGQHSGESR